MFEIVYVSGATSPHFRVVIISDGLCFMLALGPGYYEPPFSTLPPGALTFGSTGRFDGSSDNLDWKRK